VGYLLHYIPDRFLEESGRSLFKFFFFTVSRRGPAPVTSTAMKEWGDSHNLKLRHEGVWWHGRCERTWTQWFLHRAQPDGAPDEPPAAERRVAFPFRAP